MFVWTVGHGARPIEELLDVLAGAGVRTLVDVRRFPGSRRHPWFGREALAASVREAGISYRHAPDLGGRRAGVPGEERFECLRVAAFRSYAAWMGTEEWGRALDEVLGAPAPCLLCSETLWWRCHRRLIAEALHARGHEVLHLMRPGEARPHRPLDVASAHDGVLHICGMPVA